MRNHEIRIILINETDDEFDNGILFSPISFMLNYFNDEIRLVRHAEYARN